MKCNFNLGVWFLKFHFESAFLTGYKNVYETIAVGIGIPSREWDNAQGHKGTFTFLQNGS